jgi:TolB-like protein/DNA-binding winged helix-turn-helix (wHTH) protein/cytochrome c-type biogenesis protein CcmH/NrfG
MARATVRTLEVSPPVRFGPYEVNLDSGDLRKFGYRVRLQPKSFLVLRTLLERPGELVTREELKAQLWAENTFVEFESSLNVAVRRLREALGDEAQHPVYIETVPRHGYRFVGVIEATVRELVEISPASARESLAISPVGIHILTPAPRTPPLAAQKARSGILWNLLLPSLGVVLVALIGILFLKQSAARRLGGSATPSIAVLPFVDSSPGKSQEYFSDGLAEELLNELAKTPRLRVAARTSSFHFKGQDGDLRTIGQKLNVGSVLEGSVNREGNRVRITAELVNVDNGFQLWSGSYERNLDDVFAVQDEIARAVAAELKVKLLSGGAPAALPRSTNPAAYSDYLQGRYFYERRTKNDLEKATSYFEQAIKLDPGYARAWSGLAWARMSQADSAYGLSFEEGYRLARDAAEKALQLDPSLAEAHAALGRIKRTHDWDWAGADASFQKAIALEPQNALALMGASSLAASLGRFDDSVALGRRAVELDPLSVIAHVALGLRAYYAGQLDLAITAYEKALELNPGDPSAHYLLSLVYLARSEPLRAQAEAQQQPRGAGRYVGDALAYNASGHKQEADAALKTLVSNYANEAAYQIAEVYAVRGELDRAFEWLEIARTQRDAGLSAIVGDPLLKSLRSDPRYAAFLKKMRLT